LELKEYLVFSGFKTCSIDFCKLIGKLDPLPKSLSLKNLRDINLDEEGDHLKRV